MRTCLLAGIIGLMTVGTPVAQAPATRLDAVLQSFWDADPAGAGRAAEQVISLGADFDTLFARLKAGRSYRPQPTGRIEMTSRDPVGPLDNVVEIPSDYDPGRRWPVRVSLHGGVGRERPGAGGTARQLTNRIPGAGEIVIHPRAWLESAWWTPSAVENIAVPNGPNAPNDRRTIRTAPGTTRTI